MNNLELKTYEEWQKLGYTVKLNEKPVFANNNNNKKIGLFSKNQVVKKVKTYPDDD